MAKKRGLKLPKTIAGVKVPKRLRKSGRSLSGLVRHPLGREIVADVLVAAAGAAAATLLRHRPSGRQMADAGAAVADAGSSAAATAKDVAGAAVGAVGGVVAEMARQVLSPSRPSDDADRGSDNDRDAGEGRGPGEGRYAVLAAERGKKAKG